MTWQEKVKAAHYMVSALCKPRGSEGSREWVMSIPARFDYDPDLVISAGLSAAESRIAELEAWKADLTSKVAAAQKLGLDLGEREFDAFFPMWRRPRKELEKENDSLRANLARVTAERDALAARINPDGAPVDVAALCLEIDEATDSLARVKAESLRVVPDGEPCPYKWIEKEHFLHEDDVLTTHGVIEPKSLTTGKRVRVKSDTMVQPVELKRWK